MATSPRRRGRRRQLRPIARTSALAVRLRDAHPVETPRRSPRHVGRGKRRRQIARLRHRFYWSQFNLPADEAREVQLSVRRQLDALGGKL